MSKIIMDNTGISLLDGSKKQGGEWMRLRDASDYFKDLVIKFLNDQVFENFAEIMKVPYKDGASITNPKDLEEQYFFCIHLLTALENEPTMKYPDKYTIQ